MTDLETLDCEYPTHANRRAAEVVRKVFALLFRRLRSDDFLEARIAAERVPEGQQF